MYVAVLEPRELLRHGLAAVLERLEFVSGLECHGTIGELLIVCQARGHDWNPDVVIVSGARDMQVVERVRGSFPASRVLELVASDEHRDLVMAAKTHANGYLMLHETTEATLDRTLHALMRGEQTMPQPVADYLFECARSAEAFSPRLLPYFNASECAVIKLLLEGLSNRQIAQKLSISLHSAKRLVSSVLQKSNSPSRAHFAAHMLRDDTHAL
jgi:two-component system nitrate/nitrite response regulator NarL